MVAKSGRGWVLAPSLVALVDQVDARYPNRSRSSDGSIGDTAHSARKSDHNPDGGFVAAVDITHDPANGFDSYAFAELLRQRRDPRIKYVICNGRTFAGPGGRAPLWEWRPYTGSNRHDHHVHVSINPAGRGNTSSWFDGAAGPLPSPAPSGDRLLSVGVRGPDVKMWQTVLIGAGLLPAGADDGIFGPATKAATVEFQTTLGVGADGIVGPSTREATGRLLAYVSAVAGQS